jgi:outer membrane protein assembly factor BamD (BamD/ComL family)
MQGRWTGIRKLFLKGLLGLALLPLFPGSCQRRPQTPAAPPPPNLMAQGDRAFDSGDYAAAITSYAAYLRQQPTGPERDRALYRLGLALALPANPSQDPGQSIAYLNELAAQYPSSPLRAQAEIVAQLEMELEQLRSEISQREQQAEAMSRQMEQLSQQQQQDAEQLRTDLKSKEDRIRQLSEELEKLKAIDMQRRPTPPPAR